MAELDPKLEVTATQEILPKDVTFGALSDDMAIKLVVQDVQAAESQLGKDGLMTRLQSYNQLYQFKVPRQNWPDTRIERSSLGVPVVFEHLDSLRPQMLNGIFADNPPFMAKPESRTNANTARAVEVLLAYQLRNTDFRKEAGWGFYELLKDGTGIWKWWWEKEKVKVKQYSETPNMIDVPAMIDQPAGSTVTTTTATRNKVRFQWVRRRNVFVDPTLEIPDIRFAKWVAHRQYVTLRELNDMRGQGYNIPSENELRNLALPPEETTKTSPTEEISRIYDKDWQDRNAEEPSSKDPLQRPMEIIEYWTPKYRILVLQRKWLMLNSFNEYKRIPFLSSYYKWRPEAFDGIGLAELLQGEQRLQQAVINARLDDLALTLHPPILRVRGMNPMPQQIRIRPGAMFSVDQPNGLSVMERPPLNPQVYQEIEESDRRAMRRTAVNEAATMGQVSGTQGAFRTSRGAGMVQAAISARLQLVIDQFGEQVLVPFLEIVHDMNPDKLGAETINSLLSDELKQALVGEDGTPYNVTTLEVLNAKCDFEMLATTQLQARQVMAQTLPTLMQNLLVPQVMEHLKTQRKKFDFGELINMVYDVSGWPNRSSLIVDMSEEDISQMATESPAVMQMQEQQSRARELQDKLRIIEAENKGRAGRDIIKSGLKRQEMEAEFENQAQYDAGRLAGGAVEQ